MLRILEKAENCGKKQAHVSLYLNYFTNVATGY